MDEKSLKKLQSILLEIMKMLDDFCEKNEIPYTLYGGTALGAIRHQGFIPWDDDLDIAMTRADFERFRTLWLIEHPSGYYLQDPESPDSHLNHMKIRKDGTILATQEEFSKDEHHGIWVDIFAIDKVPTRRVKRELYLTIAMVNLIYTRGYPYTKGNTLLRIISQGMLLLPASIQYKIRMSTLSNIKKTANLSTGYEWKFLAAPYTMKFKLPHNMFVLYKKTRFENTEFNIVDCSNEMLSLQFGDYMKLPPESDRICKHNPEVIDFGKNATELDR